MSNLPVISDEEQAIAEEKLKIERYPKLAKWFQLFMDKSNKETFGNRTEAAIQAYDLDPIAQRVTAASMGAQNYRKLQNIIPDYLEQQGMNPHKIVDLIVAKAVSTTNAKYTQILAEIGGVYEPKASVAIQNNVNINNSIQIEKAEAQKFNNDFEQFVDAKYTQPSNPDDLIDRAEG